MDLSIMEVVDKFRLSCVRSKPDAIIDKQSYEQQKLRARMETSIHEEVADNRPLTLNKAHTPTTTIWAERQQKLQSLRDKTFTEPKVNLFYNNSSITPHPNNLEDDHNVGNVWTYDKAVRCQKNK
jgi:hypothetical protein